MAIPIVIIKGDAFRLDFSLMALLLLGEKWGLETLDQTIEKIAELDDGQAGMSLKNLRMFDEIIISLANCVDENPRVLKENEILKLPIAETMALLASFSQLMILAVQSKTTTNDESVGKQKALKRAKRPNL